MARTFVQLDLNERRRLFELLEHNVTVADIARVMGRHRSTIYREIKRNWWHDKEVPQADRYWHVAANDLAKRRRQPQRKLVRDDELREAVVQQLKTGWSPEQIAGRLRIELGVQRRICHETIYQFVYSPEGQSQWLAQYLPERRRKRKPRYARKLRDRFFPESRSIHHRPDEINDRSQLEHWEGGLMIFRREHGGTNITSIVFSRTIVANQGMSSGR